MLSLVDRCAGYWFITFHVLGALLGERDPRAGRMGKAVPSQSS